MWRGRRPGDRAQGSRAARAQPTGDIENRREAGTGRAAATSPDEVVSTRAARDSHRFGDHSLDFCIESDSCRHC